MRRISFFLLSLILFAASFSASGQNLPFKGGEKCTYMLHYKWGVINADIAKLDFTLQDDSWQGTPCFHLTTRGSTTKFISNLVKVDYLYDSRFSKADLKPLHFYREQKEGTYWAKNTYTWENQCRTMNAHVEKSTRGVRDTVLTDRSVIYDVVSLLYVIRSSDLASLKKNGGRVHYVTAMDRNLYDLYLTYVKSEDKKSPEAGTFSTDKFCMSLTRRPGGIDLSKEASFTVSSDEAGKLAPIYLWTSSGDDKTILFFSTSIAVGSINGRILGVEGGNYPLKPVK